MKPLRILFLLPLFLILLGTQFGIAEVVDRQQYNAGLIAMKNGNFEEAIKCFTKAAEINPKEYKYYNDRGVAYKRLGYLDKALADYNKCLEINPHYTNALNNRGVVYLEQRRYDDALKDFHEALKNGGLEGKILTNIGIAKAAKGDYRAAVKDFDNAVSLRPVDPRSFLFMGQSLEHLGDKDKALKMYQVALGVIKEPEIIAVVEKKIAALDQNSTGYGLPKTQKESKNNSPRSAKIDIKSEVKSSISPTKQTREIVLANRRPNYIEQIIKQNNQKLIKTTLPEALYSFNKNVRNRIINALSPASEEILSQGLEFVHKSDDYKAMVRFEDIRSLEKRNKNYLAVGWALLEIGRIYIRRGDYLKAEESIDNSLKSFSSLKALDEQILALIELARLKQLEKSADQSKALFTQAQELANTSGHSSLIQSIQDFATGPVKQQQRATAKVDINQAKIQKDKNLDSNPTLESRPKPEPPTNQVVTTNMTQSSKAPTFHVDLGKIKSVFDMKPETFRERKIAFESKPLVSPNNVVSIPKNYVVTNHSEQKNENKNSVATPTAAVHPDAIKPLAVKEQKQLPAEPVISKNQDNSSIDKEITELRKLRKQKDEAKMVPILENLSRSFYEIGDYKKALNAVNVALAFREKLGINDGRAKILELRGLVYEKLGEKVEALENLTWAGSISKTLNKSDKTKTTDLAQNLGLDVGSALNNYRALWSARESGNTQNEIKSLLELGNLYAKVHNFEEASKYYELSNASLMAERSIFYKKLGKLARARKTFEEALQALKSLDYLLYFSFINRSEYHDKISAILQ